MRYTSRVPLPRVAVAHGLRARLARGYGPRDLRADAISGVVVGMVALPLSMALAIASGAPPQHGLYTAIVAGIAVSLLGGARMQVTGPTAAFVALLVPVVHQHGLGGLLVAGLMAGVIQIGMGLARMGKLVELVPHPVTTGFTAGIAVVIASIQLEDFFGLTVAGAPADFAGRLATFWSARASASPIELAIGAGTLVLLFAIPRRSKIPGPLVALSSAAVAAALTASLAGVEVATIGSVFSFVVDGETVRGIPTLPPMPAWPWSHGGAGGGTLVIDFELVQELLPAAFAIAMLGAIETLLSAVIADGVTGDRHDPDAELVALGVGNVLCPFFGGIPATAALARTAMNIRAGAESPLSCVFHSLFILASTLVLAPLMAYLPMAAMAGMLLFVAYNMSEAGHFVRLLRTASRSDVVMLVTCFVLTIVFDMVVAVGVGVVLGALLFMRRMSEVTRASLDTELSRRLEAPEGVLIYRIAGPLFFGAAQKAMQVLAPPQGTSVVVLDMSAVPVIDATGMAAMEGVMRSLAASQCKIIFAGLADEPRETMTRAGVVRRSGQVAFAPELDAALSIATLHLARATTRA